MHLLTHTYTHTHKHTLSHYKRLPQCHKAHPSQQQQTKTDKDTSGQTKTHQDRQRDNTAIRRQCVASQCHSVEQKKHSAVGVAFTACMFGVVGLGSPTTLARTATAAEHQACDGHSQTEQHPHRRTHHKPYQVLGPLKQTVTHTVTTLSETSNQT